MLTLARFLTLYNELAPKNADLLDSLDSYELDELAKRWLAQLNEHSPILMECAHLPTYENGRRIADLSELRSLANELLDASLE